MTFLEWLGNDDKTVAAERDAQLVYARNFAMVTVFCQTTALLFMVGNYPGAGMLAIWTAFLVLCLGLPPAPSFLPKATTPRGHQSVGAAIALLGLAFQAMFFMIVYASVSRLQGG